VIVLQSKKHEDKKKPTDKLLSTLANNVIRLRKQKAMTQEGLGEACEFHSTFISMIERKQRNVTISTVEILAGALGVTPSELLQDSK
jgi:transcriptional regulator with XRE-family HTH domain